MRFSETRECATSSAMSSSTMDRRVKSRSKAHRAKYKKPLHGRIFRAADESLF
jgi:hypothetical protein